MSQVKTLDKLKDVTLEGNPDQRADTIRLLKASIPLAVELLAKGMGVSPLSPMSAAAMAAFQTVTSLVASATPKCNIASPAEDIEVKVDGSGNMVYRCLHQPAHEWDLSGKKLP